MAGDFPHQHEARAGRPVAGSMAYGVSERCIRRVHNYIPAFAGTIRNRRPAILPVVDFAHRALFSI